MDFYGSIGKHGGLFHSGTSTSKEKANPSEYLTANPTNSGYATKTKTRNAIMEVNTV